MCIRDSHRSGLYPLKLPTGIGAEGAGIITSIGSGVKDFKVGDKVSYAGAPLGAYSTHRNYPTQNLVKVPENIDLDIKYEDDSIIVINKKSGMVVHPGHGNYSGTLINGLLYHFDNLPNNSSNRPGLVHRIDKDTSGLLVIAKTEKSMTILAKQFFKKSVEREYLALVWGDVKNDEGEINAPIGRNPKNRLQMIVYEDLEGGKDAITNYKVIERFGYVTLVSCKLKTGRTHQIRVHMKYLGHTLFNDERYGGCLLYTSDAADE